MSPAVGLAAATPPWLWRTANAVALTLLFLNVLLIVAVHGRRLRESVRRRRTKLCRARVEVILAELDPATRAHDPEWLRKEIARFDELARPIAATMLIERLKPASEDERRHTLEALREVGAIDALVRSTRRRIPWRRALAIRTLGWTGATETVPVLIDRLSDDERQVRESAVRALGRIGDTSALPPLESLFLSPGRVGSGIVYDALVAFGRASEPVFANGLHSEIASVRVASCFGVAAVCGAGDARGQIKPLLYDDDASVRSAAAESLEQVGGEFVPDALAEATRDEHPSVRSAATSALGSFDHPRAVELAVAALRDPEREIAVRAGEALVRLTHRPAAKSAATVALDHTSGEWPVERALTFASLGTA
jgi:HEAT repeat protein